MTFTAEHSVYAEKTAKGHKTENPWGISQEILVSLSFVLFDKYVYTVHWCLHSWRPT